MRREKKALPFIIASSRNTTPEQVLATYQKCCDYLKGVYTPSPMELSHGLSQMSNAPTTKDFYYSVVKEVYKERKPDYSLSALAMKQFKQHGYAPGMKQVYEEDMDVNTASGAQANLVLTSYFGMWEKALELTQKHPKLIKQSSSNKRILVSTLCSAGKTDTALSIIGGDIEAKTNSTMMRPIVKQFSLKGDHAAALRLAARIMAGGAPLNTSLFSAVISSLRATGLSGKALETAADLNLFSMSRAEAQRNIALFNRLVDCLYDENPDRQHDIEDIVSEMSSRMSPKNDAYRVPQKTQRFRIRTQFDMSRHRASLVFPLSHIYGKVLSVSKWYTKNLAGIVDVVTEDASTALVIDTNFLIQCISKNLPIEHFYQNIVKQNPHLQGYNMAVIVIPFTAIQEAYTLIWDQNNRLRHSVKLLMWSRVQAFIRKPSVYVLSLGCEHSASSLAVISAMAYRKQETTSVSKDHFQDPDVRVLNVCLYLQYAFRVKSVGTSQRASLPEGAHLFSFLKYHVRRYKNTVKGRACDRLILCTLDKQLSRAAREAGVDCFPSFHNNGTTTTTTCSSSQV